MDATLLSLQERVDNRKTPQNTVQLLTSTIKAGADEEGLRYCFRVVSPEKVYLLQVSWLTYKSSMKCTARHDYALTPAMHYSRDSLLWR